MSSDAKKNAIQALVLQEWIKNKFYGSVLLGTGVGKSKLGTDVIKEVASKVQNFDIPILIGVDKISNRDKTWVEELKKWGVDDSNITIECYQTIYKWKDKNIGLFIADELDVAITEEYSKSFTQNNIKFFLGLTATITAKKERLLNTFAPFFYRFSSEDSQKAGLINNTVVIKHYVPLSTVHNIKTKYGHWSEVAKHRWFTKKIDANLNEIEENFTNIIKEKLTYVKLAITAKNNKLLKLNKALKFKRAKFLKELESLDKYAVKLKKAILKDKENKVLLFAKFTSTVDSFGESYHYKNKNDNIERFNSGEINYLGVCKSVSRGISFVDLNHIVGHSYDGTETYYTQAIQGRATRLQVKELAYLHILIPIEGKIPTRAEVWVEEMTQKVDKANIHIYDQKTGILKYCKNIKEKR